MCGSECCRDRRTTSAPPCSCRRSFSSSRSSPMQFMMMHKTDAYYEAGGLPSKELIADVGEMVGAMVKSGELFAADGFRSSSEGVRLKFADGKRTVIHGPFLGGNEVITASPSCACARSTRPSTGRHGTRLSSATRWSTFAPRRSRGTSASARNRRGSRRDVTSRCTRPIRNQRPARHRRRRRWLAWKR